MEDNTLRDLVSKHDTVITQLVTSVEHLVSSQTETNKRLEEISKFLAKQVVFSTKLENMDKEIAESFSRVHNRIDQIDGIQQSEGGCNSVKLLTKDVHSITKDVNRLIGNVEEQRMQIENNKRDLSVYPSTATIKWIAGLIIFYSATFSIYTVQSLSKLNSNLSKITVLLERDIKDTNQIMSKIK